MMMIKRSVSLYVELVTRWQNNQRWLNLQWICLCQVSSKENSGRAWFH